MSTDYELNEDIKKDFKDMYGLVGGIRWTDSTYETLSEDSENNVKNIIAYLETMNHYLRKNDNLSGIFQHYFDLFNKNLNNYDKQKNIKDLDFSNKAIEEYLKSDKYSTYENYEKINSICKKLISHFKNIKSIDLNDTFNIIRYNNLYLIINSKTSKSYMSNYKDIKLLESLDKSNNKKYSIIYGKISYNVNSYNASKIKFQYEDNFNNLFKYLIAASCIKYNIYSDHRPSEMINLIENYDVDLVINLTKFIEIYDEENHEVKCFDYIKELMENQELKTKYNLNQTKTGKVYDYYESNKLKIMHFTSWPDHGVPDNYVNFHSLVENAYIIIKEINKTKKSGEKANVVVHCSAGVGRTGTFIIALLLYSKMKDGNLEKIYNIKPLKDIFSEKKIKKKYKLTDLNNIYNYSNLDDIKDNNLISLYIDKYIIELRKQRSNMMVQTKEQYIYLLGYYLHLLSL